MQQWQFGSDRLLVTHSCNCCSLRLCRTDEDAFRLLSKRQQGFGILVSSRVRRFAAATQGSMHRPLRAQCMSPCCNCMPNSPAVTPFNFLFGVHLLR